VPVKAAVTDPIGDTCGAGCPGGPATGATIYDITGVNTLRFGSGVPYYNILSVSVTFLQPAVVLAASGAAPDPAGADLVANVYIDVDNNPATGSTFSPCGANGTYNGVDYVIVARTSFLNGGYPLYALPSNTQVGGGALVEVNGNTVTYSVQIADIGNSQNGPFNVAVSVGNSQTVSDCAANGGFTPATVRSGSSSPRLH
jgi:hypothetical protein